MSQDSAQVSRLCNVPPYRNPNNRITTVLFATKDTLINEHVFVYFQVVFQYFREPLQYYPRFGEALISLLRDFGWLPRQFRHQEQLTGLLMPMFAIWRANEFYETNITPPNERRLEWVTVQTAHVRQLPFPVDAYHGPVRDGNDIHRNRSARFGDLYDLLIDSVLNYEALYLNTAPGQQVPLDQHLVYYMRISFATTLYREFCHQVNLVIPAYMDRINNRLPTFIRNFMRTLDINKQARVEYIRFAFGVLLQCPRLANGDETVLRLDYRTYLTHIGLNRENWDWPVPAADNDNHSQYRHHYNQLLDRHLLLTGWTAYLQRVIIIPSLSDEWVTNGMLIEYLVESMRTQPANQVLNAYDIRNQIIFLIALAPEQLYARYNQLWTGQAFVFEP